MNLAKPVLVVMGVAGCGKSTLGLALADRLGWTFKDGDDLHTPAAVAKMRAGQPLGDLDRAPWLRAVEAWIDACLEQDGGGVITCSALKWAYRDGLAAGRPWVKFVFIELSPEAAAERIGNRRDHFFPPSLLASQFAALEPPADDESVIRVDGTLPIATMVDEVAARIG